jgi:hypothetical protein
MSDNFNLEEYKSLRDEALKKVATAEALEFYAAGAVAAVYAWLASNNVPETAWLWVVPVMFPILGALRAWTLDRQLGVIGDYLKGLEQALSPGTERWESYRVSNIGRYKDWAAQIFWPALLIVTLVIPVYFWHAAEACARSENPVATRLSIVGAKQ